MSKEEIKQMDKEIHGEPEPQDHEPMDNPMDKDGPMGPG